MDDKRKTVRLKIFSNISLSFHDIVKGLIEFICNTNEHIILHIAGAIVYATISVPFRKENSFMRLTKYSYTKYTYT